jgi:2-polyprenyl-6-methoxyphenol hydroxylase-like FAD-dependent oxidoreductase
MEPILVRHATANGFNVRFSTRLLSFVDHGPKGRIVATVRDELTKAEYQIRAKYLFGADGARSVVVKELGLPLNSQPGKGTMINVLVRADLSHLMKTRPGLLHWCMQLERDDAPDFGVACIVRMVKPWYEWLFILVAAPGFDPHKTKVSEEQYLKRIKEIVGDDTEAKILHVSPWTAHETFAEEYSKGNV